MSRVKDKIEGVCGRDEKVMGIIGDNVSSVKHEVHKTVFNVYVC